MAVNNELYNVPSAIMDYISNDIGAFDKYIVYCSDRNGYYESDYVLVKSSFGDSGYTQYTYHYNSNTGQISKSSNEYNSAFPTVQNSYYCYSNISGQGKSYELPYTNQLNMIALWFIGLTLMVGVLISCIFRRRRI